jgi:hypothetical protein
MLTRLQFYSIVSGVYVAVLIGVLLVSLGVTRFALPVWTTDVLAILIVATGQTSIYLLTGGELSYRKYVAAAGRPLIPPSRFWATTGQAIVLICAAVLLVVFSYIASRAGDLSPWKAITTAAWIVLPPVTILYCLLARDWRRELASAPNAS